MGESTFIVVFCMSLGVVVIPPVNTTQVPKVGGEIQIQMFVSGAGQFWWHLGFGDLIIGFVCGT